VLDDIDGALLVTSTRLDGEPPSAVLDWPKLSWLDGWHLRCMANPTRNQIETVLALVARGEVTSAALFAAEPSPDRRWLALEFSRCFVTCGPVDIGLLRELGWFPDEGQGFVVWSAHRADSGQADFAARILDAAPSTIEISSDEDLGSSVFGALASNRQRGSSALMSLSGAQPGLGPIRLRNPASLELDLITAHDSIPHLVEAGHIGVMGVGATVGMAAADLDVDGFTDPDEARSAWQSVHRSGYAYWLIIQVTPHVDPRVGIPPGHIFEQLDVNGVQTLAVASGTSFIVGESAPHTVVVPAWCLNQNLSAPSGQQVASTPLRARYSAGLSQSEVWRDRSRVVSG
jgi:hypothetical protein